MYCKFFFLTSSFVVVVLIWFAQEPYTKDETLERHTERAERIVMWCNGDLNFSLREHSRLVDTSQTSHVSRQLLDPGLSAET